MQFNLTDLVLKFNKQMRVCVGTVWILWRHLLYMTSKLDFFVKGSFRFQLKIDNWNILEYNMNVIVNYGHQKPDMFVLSESNENVD